MSVLATYYTSLDLSNTLVVYSDKKPEVLPSSHQDIVDFLDSGGQYTTSEQQTHGWTKSTYADKIYHAVVDDAIDPEIMRYKMGIMGGPVSLYVLVGKNNDSFGVVGPGCTFDDDNPPINVRKGCSYIFYNRSDSLHPIEIRDTPGGSAISEVEYLGNGFMYWEPLFTETRTQVLYECTNHPSMSGIINIVN